MVSNNLTEYKDTYNKNIVQVFGEFFIFKKKLYICKKYLEISMNLIKFVNKIAERVNSRINLCNADFQIKTLLGFFSLPPP